MTDRKEIEILAQRLRGHGYRVEVALDTEGRIATLTVSSDTHTNGPQGPLVVAEWARAYLRAVDG